MMSQAGWQLIADYWLVVTFPQGDLSRSACLVVHFANPRVGSWLAP